MNSPPAAAAISDELKTYIESGVSVLVGTRDMGLAPEITRAWGVLVSEDGGIVNICVPKATSRKTIENLASNGQIAVTFALPTNMKSVQLKGTCIETREPEPADLAAVERHREAFAVFNEQIGVPRPWFERFWKRELETSNAFVKLRFVPEQIFNQTPGPGAGTQI